MSLVSESHMPLLSDKNENDSTFQMHVAAASALVQQLVHKEQLRVPWFDDDYDPVMIWTSIFVLNQNKLLMIAS